MYLSVLNISILETENIEHCTIIKFLKVLEKLKKKSHAKNGPNFVKFGRNILIWEKYIKH